MSKNKKPRIAEILGVEVGERFCLKSFYPHVVTFWVKSDGTFETEPQGISGSSVALLRAVECPGLVIHEPRWTEQDREDAMALKRLIVNASHVYRASEGSNPKLYDKYEDFVSVLRFDCYAALPPRTDVTLDEIIGGAE